MKRVLITGATGFLGEYTVNEFRQHGYQVIATGRNADKLRKLVKPRVKIRQINLEELASLDMKVDIVIHVAGLSTIWGSWHSFYTNNVIGTEHVITFCRRNNVKRLVFISSPSIYSNKGNRINIKEQEYDPKNRLNNYIRSKIIAEQLISKAHSKTLETVILRPRGLIGIGDVSIVPRLLKTNKTFGIPLFNNGHNLVDLTCVENVALAARLAAEKQIANGQVYNITNGEPRQLITILDTLFKAIDLKPRYKFRRIGVFYWLAGTLEIIYSLLRIQKEPPFTRYTINTLGYSQTLDISKARNELGYKPIYSLDEGIKHYVEKY